MLFLAVAAWAAPCDHACLDAALAGRDPAVVAAVVPELSEVVSAEEATALRVLLGPDGTSVQGSPLAPPDHGDVYIDGFLSLTRPDDVGALVQQVGRDGAVVQSVWLRPGDAVPDWSRDHAPRASGKTRVSPLAIGLGTAGLVGFATGAILVGTGIDACTTLDDCGQRNTGIAVAVTGAVLLVGAGLTINVQL